jgi:hypothetical protein
LVLGVVKHFGLDVMDLSFGAYISTFARGTRACGFGTVVAQTVRGATARHDSMADVCLVFV